MEEAPRVTYFIVWFFKAKINYWSNDENSWRSSDPYLRITHSKPFSDNQLFKKKLLLKKKNTIKHNLEIYLIFCCSIKFLLFQKLIKKYKINNKNYRMNVLSKNNQLSFWIVKKIYQGVKSLLDIIVKLDWDLKHLER